MTRLRSAMVALGSVVLPASSACSPAAEAPGDTEVEIEYIGHASFVVRSPAGVEVLIDPYASRVWIGYDFPTGVTPDVVVITHPHYDHDAGRYRGADFPWPDARVVDSPGTLVLDDVRIVGIEGKHADPYGMEFGQLNTLMVVEVAGLRIAHVGDNGPLSDDARTELGAVDVLMMPMDSAYHILSPEETADMRRAVPHKILVPMHYRLPDLEPAADQPEDLGPIGPVLRGEERVRHVGSHLLRLRAADLPAASEMVVFERSPAIPHPEAVP